MDALTVKNVFLQELVRDKNIEYDIILLSPEILSCCKMFTYDYRAELSLGSLTLKVRVRPDSQGGIFAVSNLIIEKLNLPEHIKINMLITGNKIKLGPLVGTFIMENTIKKLENVFAQPSDFTRNSESEGVLLHFLSYKEIDWSQNLAGGYIYNFMQQKWEKRELPFPDVLITKSFSGFEIEQKDIVENIVQQFTKSGVKKINSQNYFDKWDTYDRLRKYNELSCFMPDTTLYRNREDLESILKNHHCIFAKGCRGGNGREVIKVQKQSDKYIYSYFKYERLITGSASNFSELEKVILTFLNKKRFILQEGIDVLSVKERAADIRCLMQKDQHGCWNVTSWPLRVAAYNSPVTSTVTGSRVYSLDEGLKICGLSTEEISTVKKKCLEFLRLFLEALETEFGPFGEVGIDLAVDKNYNLWYLECNANPAKTATKIAGTEEEKHLSIVNPLRYAKYLAGF